MSRSKIYLRFFLDFSIRKSNWILKKFQIRQCPSYNRLRVQFTVLWVSTVSDILKAAVTSIIVW